MGHPVEIKALFFVLKGGSPRTEIVFLNQNLPICPSSVVRNFRRDLLRTLPHRLFHFVDEARNRLRAVEFSDNSFDGCRSVRSSNACLRVPDVHRANSQPGGLGPRMNTRWWRRRRCRFRPRRVAPPLHHPPRVVCEAASVRSFLYPTEKVPYKFI